MVVSNDTKLHPRTLKNYMEKGVKLQANIRLLNTPRHRFVSLRSSAQSAKKCKHFFASIATPNWGLLLLRNKSPVRGWESFQINNPITRMGLFIWWLLPDSNWGHKALQASALPTELKSHILVHDYYTTKLYYYVIGFLCSIILF